MVLIAYELIRLGRRELGEVVRGGDVGCGGRGCLGWRSVLV